MASVATAVLSTVNAPYGTSLCASDLAAIIGDPSCADRFDPSAFAFFSEVDARLQRAFIIEMGLDFGAALELACRFSELAGYSLPLSPSDDDNHGSIPYDESVEMIRKDVEERFGPIPGDWS
ncbi:hypothetical protein D3C71_188560 [compost metagenome]